MIWATDLEKVWFGACRAFPTSGQAVSKLVPSPYEDFPENQARTQNSGSCRSRVGLPFAGSAYGRRPRHSPSLCSRRFGEMAEVDSDSVLLDFLSSLMDYTPTIPDELAEHYLSRGGFYSPDIRVTRLVSLAAQKFIGEIASDALQFCKIRQASAKASDKARGHQGKDKRLILTAEDLAAALHEYGVNIKRQEYFADSPAAGVAPPKEKVDE